MSNLNFYKDLRDLLTSNDHDKVISECRDYYGAIINFIKDNPYMDTKKQLALTNEIYYVRSIESAALSMRIAQIENRQTR